MELSQLKQGNLGYFVNKGERNKSRDEARRQQAPYNSS